jgi:GNAT superfamily N-acetyltransferase
VKLVAVTDLSAEQSARARQIYEDGFPVELRSDFEKLFVDPCFAVVDDGRVVGWAVLRPLGRTGWIFLRYFVAGERGQGIGSRMWRAMREHFAEYERILLDVEDPEEPGIGSEEEAVRRQRVAFYRRLGIEVLPLRSYRPPHGGEEQSMQLLASDLPPGDPTPTLGRDGIRQIVLAVYELRYGVTTADAVVRRTLADSGLS